MFTFFMDVLSNLLANVVYVILGGIFFVLLGLPFVYRKRRNLFKFFGLTKDNPKLIVYFSTVFVQPYGSKDFRGEQRSFWGPAVPASELFTIMPIAALFKDTLLDNLPVPLRNWLGNKVHWSFKPIFPIFSASPEARNQIEQSNIITIGSQYYNSVGDLYTETCSPFLKMEQVGEKMIIRVRKGPRVGDVFELRSGETDDLAIVERLYDKETKTTVFIAAGVGVVGTVGAVLFIVERWRNLQKDFGSKCFAYCLRFQDIWNDPNAYRKPIELSRFQED